MKSGVPCNSAEISPAASCTKETLYCHHFVTEKINTQFYYSTKCQMRLNANSHAEEVHVQIITRKVVLTSCGPFYISNSAPFGGCVMCNKIWHHSKPCTFHDMYHTDAMVFFLGLIPEIR